MENGELRRVIRRGIGKIVLVVSKFYAQLRAPSHTFNHHNSIAPSPTSEVLDTIERGDTGFKARFNYQGKNDVFDFRRVEE